MAARPDRPGAKANDGSNIAASIATTRLFDAQAQARYRIALGEHSIIPFAGQQETIALMNQDYGRSGSTRYFVGSEYAYDPLNFGLSLQGFRELGSDADPLEGVRSEVSLSSDLPQGYGTLSPYLSAEQTNLYLETGGGITHDWGGIPGQLSLEVRRKFTYDIHHSDYSGLMTVDFNF